MIKEQHLIFEMSLMIKRLTIEINNIRSNFESRFFCYETITHTEEFVKENN